MAESEKECFAVQATGGAVEDPPPQLLAWVRRLGEQLSTGFCEGRRCDNCDVNKDGDTFDGLSSREILVRSNRRGIEAYLSSLATPDES